MICLTAKIRLAKGRKTNTLRTAGKIPAVVYGSGIKNESLEIDAREFQKVYRQAGESSLIELSVDGEKEKKLVLVHELQKDPVSDIFIHVDFYQPSLKEETQVTVPLVFEGESLAVKELGGTLVKNISEIEVKALPQNLPHEIKVSVENLKTFDDRILVKDLILPKGVSVAKNPDEIVVMAAPAEKVEEELAKEIEEKVEAVGQVEKPKKEEESVEEPPAEKK